MTTLKGKRDGKGVRSFQGQGCGSGKAGASSNAGASVTVKLICQRVLCAFQEGWQAGRCHGRHNCNEGNCTARARHGAARVAGESYGICNTKQECRNAPLFKERVKLRLKLVLLPFVHVVAPCGRAGAFTVERIRRVGGYARSGARLGCSNGSNMVPSNYRYVQVAELGGGPQLRLWTMPYL